MNKQSSGKTMPKGGVFTMGEVGERPSGNSQVKYGEDLRNGGEGKKK